MGDQVDVEEEMDADTVTAQDSGGCCDRRGVSAGEACDRSQARRVVSGR